MMDWKKFLDKMQRKSPQKSKKYYEKKSKELKAKEELQNVRKEYYKTLVTHGVKTAGYYSYIAGIILIIVSLIITFIFGFNMITLGFWGATIFSWLFWVFSVKFEMPSGESLVFALIFVGIPLIIGIFWFVGAGGVQATYGMTYTGSKLFESIANSLSIKRFIAELQNPFGVQPTGGSYEETEEGEQTPPTEALTVVIQRASTLVNVDKNQVVFAVNIKNEGSHAVKKAILTVWSDHPKSDSYPNGCLRFDTLPDGCEEKEEGIYECTIENVPAHGIKTITFSKGKIDYNCLNNAVPEGLKEGVPVDVFINAKVRTYYIAASRLSVEKISDSYGELLLKHNMLIQKDVGAIYQAGSALAMDMDVGPQPIFDSADSVVLLLRWIKVGSGKLCGAPTLFIITPPDFGECKISDGDECFTSKADCENDDVRGTIEKYFPNAEETYDWMCGLVDEGYHVCKTTAAKDELQTYNCAIDVSKFHVKEGLHRETRYITLFGIYPFANEDYTSIQAVYEG